MERAIAQQREIESQKARELFELCRQQEFNVGWKWEHMLRPLHGDVRDALPCSKMVVYSTMRLSHGASYAGPCG